jgi:hypothetical protein
VDQISQDRSALVGELRGDPRLAIRAEEIICLICGAALQRRYADRAVGGALASKIRRRPILDDPTLRVRGSARPMSLEERLNRREGGAGATRADRHRHHILWRPEESRPHPVLD